MVGSLNRHISSRLYVLWRGPCLRPVIYGSKMVGATRRRFLH